MSPRRGPGRTRVRSADEALPPGTADLFVSQLRIDPDATSEGHPFDLPAIRTLLASAGSPSTGRSPSSWATTARGSPP